MWKRDEQPKSTSDVGQTPVPTAPPPSPPSTAASSPPDMATSSVAAPIPRKPGSSLFIKGQISAAEDLMLYGRIEGKVSLPGHVLTIAPESQVSAEIVARTLIIQGSVTGNVTATERFEIRPNGKMTGDVTCPSVVMTEGSEFSGRVDMRRSFAQGDGPPKDGDRRRERSTD
jgi:cytoskeletal protein CcmA (bactofilin family)